MNKDNTPNSNTPEMKSLFWGGNNCFYTDEATLIEDKIYRLLLSHVKEYVDKGYSPRELFYLVESAAKGAELDFLIELHDKNHKAKNEECQKESMGSVVANELKHLLIQQYEEQHK